MLERLRNARLIWPTLSALAGLAVLIGLGTWQLERKRWKEDLLTRIGARVNAEPIALQEAERRARDGADVDYLHVIANGRFHHDKERYLYAPAPASLAWHVYAPLELPDKRVLWVNRGAVPDARKNPATRVEGQVAGEQSVRGLVRVPAGRARFAPDNAPDANIWYWPELDAMTASVFGTQKVAVVPFAVDADAQPRPPGGLPQGGVTRIALPNRHFEYALTWYGLALALVAVYLAFFVNRLRLPRTDPGCNSG